MYMQKNIALQKVSCNKLFDIAENPKILKYGLLFKTVVYGETSIVIHFLSHYSKM